MCYSILMINVLYTLSLLGYLYGEDDERLVSIFGIVVACVWLFLLCCAVLYEAYVEWRTLRQRHAELLTASAIVRTAVV